MPKCEHIYRKGKNCDRTAIWQAENPKAPGVEPKVCSLHLVAAINSIMYGETTDDITVTKIYVRGT